MILFYGGELSAPRPTPKLEDHPLSAARDCLFNLFAATLHIGGRSSIRNVRTRHAVVTGTHKHGGEATLAPLYVVPALKCVNGLIRLWELLVECKMPKW